jgi:hypothetical protein
MRSASWLRWFNSFGFITVVIFLFAFITTMDFSSAVEKRRLPVPELLAKSGSGQMLDRFGSRMAVQNKAATAPFYLVQGSLSQTYPYKAW